MHEQLHARRRGGVRNHQLPRTIKARQPSKWMELHGTYFVLTQIIIRSSSSSSSSSSSNITVIMRGSQ
jgi:hypothetical protein